MKLNLVSSLRGRYALVTLLLSVSLLAGSFFGQSNLSKNRDIISSNIETRNQLLQRSRYIRTTVWEARESLSLYLLMPEQQQYPDYVHLAIQQAIEHTEQFKQHRWIKEQNKIEAIEQLRISLLSFDDAVTELIKARSNPDIQYPAMAIGRNKMQRYNDEVVNAVNLALDETISESQNVITTNYKKFDSIKSLWTQMISLFRIYLANSIGSYDISSIPLQEKGIKTIYNEIKFNINYLEKIDARNELGFESSDALHTIDTAVNKWYIGFREILKIHKSVLYPPKRYCDRGRIIGIKTESPQLHLADLQ